MKFIYLFTLPAICFWLNACGGDKSTKDPVNAASYASRVTSSSTPEEDAQTVCDCMGEAMKSSDPQKGKATCNETIVDAKLKDKLSEYSDYERYEAALYECMVSSQDAHPAKSKSADKETPAKTAAKTSAKTDAKKVVPEAAISAKEKVDTDSLDAAMIEYNKRQEKEKQERINKVEVFAADPFWIAWTNAKAIPEEVATYDPEHILAPMFTFDKDVDEDVKELSSTEKATRKKELDSTYFRVSFSLTTDDNRYKEGSKIAPISIYWGEIDHIFTSEPKMDCCGGYEGMTCSEESDCAMDDLVYRCVKGTCRRDQSVSCKSKDVDMCFSSYLEREEVKLNLPSAEDAEYFSGEAYYIVKIKSVVRHLEKDCEGTGEDRYCSDDGDGFAPIASVVAMRIEDSEGKVVKSSGKPPQNSAWKFNAKVMAESTDK